MMKLEMKKKSCTDHYVSSKRQMLFYLPYLTFKVFRSVLGIGQKPAEPWQCSVIVFSCRHITGIGIPLTALAPTEPARWAALTNNIYLRDCYGLVTGGTGGRVPRSEKN